MAAVDIVNSALIKLGQKRIVALDEGSERADVANQQYEAIRNNLLHSHVWNFATIKKKLAQSAIIPVYEFEYQYPVPADFLRLITLSADDAGVSQPRYRLAYDATDGRVAMTDVTEVWLTYVAEVTDTERMPPSFKEALAWALAEDLAQKITASNTMMQLTSQKAESALRIAKSADGIEQYPQRRNEGSWTSVRRGRLSAGGWG